tara:strand:+ start:475 stop:858 length:384 start_codon:yes stop_codon:yes gene_type:complete
MEVWFKKQKEIIMAFKMKYVKASFPFKQKDSWAVKAGKLDKTENGFNVADKDKNYSVSREEYETYIKENNSSDPFKQKYPEGYTDEDIKFLKEQKEDVVRYEDLDEKGKEIWKKQGKPIPKNKQIFE